MTNIPGFLKEIFYHYLIQSRNDYVYLVSHIFILTYYFNFLNYVF